MQTAPQHLVKKLHNLSSEQRGALFASIDRVSFRYLDILNFPPTESVEYDVRFQRTFNAFYQVRRNCAWRKKFYALFEELRDPNAREQRTFEHVLSMLHAHTGQWEYSFSTKLLHTLDTDKAIVDRRVLDLLNLPKKGWRHIDPYIEHYSLVERSVKYLVENLNDLLLEFDACLPKLEHIPVVKKVDLILWRYRA